MSDVDNACKQDPVHGVAQGDCNRGGCDRVKQIYRPTGCCFCHLMNPVPKGHEKYLPTTIEQIANVITHFLPLLMSAWGLYFMLTTVCDSFTETMVAYIFGSGLITCFGVSTLYHLSSLLFEDWTPYFLLFDLSGIFLLISCAYTPWMVLTLPETYSGPIICIIIWGLGIFGIIKTFTKFLPSISEISIYLLMSGMSVFTFYPLMDAGLITFDCLMFLIAGILLCGVGFLFFTQDGRIPFAHAIFHSFVAIGMLSHYYAVHVYVMDIVKSS